MTDHATLDHLSYRRRDERSRAARGVSVTAGAARFVSAQLGCYLVELAF
jgi:hypothetical protein